MAGLLSNTVLRGIRSTKSFRSMVALESFSSESLKYSTSDSDMHEDFKPTNKLANSSISVKDIVEEDVKKNPVMIYMKGVLDAPRCGFSALAVRVLKEYGVQINARNILEDQVLKNSVKALRGTALLREAKAEKRAIFIRGEFVGGSDIILNMHKTGELKEKLKDIAKANHENA